MTKIKILACLSGIFFCLQTLFPQPLPKVSDYLLVIDTDCDINDFRAIAMLLSNNAVNTLAITISPGTANPEKAAQNIAGLLKITARSTIPVGIGDLSIPVLNSDPDELKNSVIWTKEQIKVGKLPSAVDLLSDIIDNTDKKITILAMGMLTNIAELIHVKPSVIDRIDRIIWYNDNVSEFITKNISKKSNDITSKEELKYQEEKERKVLNSGIRIDIISNLAAPEAIFNLSLLKGQNKNTTLFYNVLNSFYTINTFSKDQLEKQIQLKDELLSLYLFNPDLFNMSTIFGNRMVRNNTDIDNSAIQEIIHDMIDGRYYYESNIIFTKFPVSRDMFSYDIRHIIDSVIIKYGMEEWKACVLTNEFHGHLGIYSIIGVKMGILAREYFNVDRDVLKVHSYAGYITPYSCLNDGLQVSTGATLGMNLISVTETKKPVIMAEFSHENKTILIRLKQEYAEQIESDITEGIVQFGLTDDGYWKLVRKASIKYWLEWDRKELFEIEKLTDSKK